MRFLPLILLVMHLRKICFMSNKPSCYLVLKTMLTYRNYCIKIRKITYDKIPFLLRKESLSADRTTEGPYPLAFK